MSLLKKAQDMQAMQMQQMMATIDAVSPAHLGRNVDKMA